MKLNALVSALLVSLAVALPALAASNVAPLNLSPFNTSGKWITAKDGRVFISHGLNSDNKVAPYEPFLRPEDADLMAKEGFTNVRLGVHWSEFEPEPGKYNEAYIESTRKHIAMLHERGIYTLLAFMVANYSEDFVGEGAPKWAVFTDGIPNIKTNDYLIALSNPAEWRAYDNFWANRKASDGVGIQDHYAKLWAHLALRLRNEPGVLGFDIMNEPQAGTTMPACMASGYVFGCPDADAKFSAFSAKMEKAIHQVDPNRLVFFEPNYLPGVKSNTVLKAPRTVFSFHNYCPTMILRQLSLPYVAPSDTYGLCFAMEANTIKIHHDKSIKDGNAVMMNEFGATEDVKDIAHVMDVADKYQLGWTEWAWWAKDDAGSGDDGHRPWEGVIYDRFAPPSGDNLNHEKLHVLSRPHPLLVSGTPTAYKYDMPTRTFTLSYKTALPGARANPDLLTEVMLPVRQYPNGYNAVVTGGTRVSAPGAPLLLIKAQPWATTVSVRVTPTGALPPVVAPVVSLIPKVVLPDLKAKLVGVAEELRKDPLSWLPKW